MFDCRMLKLSSKRYSRIAGHLCAQEQETSLGCQRREKLRPVSVRKVYRGLSPNVLALETTGSFQSYVSGQYSLGIASRALDFLTF